ncbi:hypothetical protein ACVWZ8_004881 [Arthrobacter sp. UYCu723]
MLHPDIQEQRPLAVFADLDEPCLEGVVLLVADMFFKNDVVDGLDDPACELVDPLLAGCCGVNCLFSRNRAVAPAPEEAAVA